ncbi:hypothetical protein PP586_gp67 [Pseudoalteromonas phage vB_PspS-H40/1]|uniref:hypothetical protein n=1 Tax=Pseudoalteromonas phage vB_PspS-H40/1 TaxID=1856120 RepID=UPI0007DCBE76|nr:hypothetical protein PP586_gp67 [Pseudoalteromonas phage vB_PspS-H40/1]ANI22084.1 hypothetical protein H401_67 [Pseudoalteromonas phage vB_PspS-H40/1]
MTLLADFEQQRLLNHIRTSGLLDGFTDFLGNAQGATQSASSYIDMTTYPANERLLQVRLSGNDQFADGSIGMTQYPCSVYVFSKANIEDEGITSGLTSDLVKWLRANYQSDAECIISIQVLGKGGPYMMEDSRVYFEIPLNVRFNTDNV